MAVRVYSKMEEPQVALSNIILGDSQGLQASRECDYGAKTSGKWICNATANRCNTMCDKSETIARREGRAWKLPVLLWNLQQYQHSTFFNGVSQQWICAGYGRLDTYDFKVIMQQLFSHIMPLSMKVKIRWLFLAVIQKTYFLRRINRFL